MSENKEKDDLERRLQELESERKTMTSASVFEQAFANQSDKIFDAVEALK